MINRLARVCEVLKRELGVIIPREIDVRSALVTVASVDITPDLKQAHVYVSAMGNSPARRKIMQGLDDSRVRIQAELNKRMKMKQTPHLHFHLDESIERGTRVIKLMDDLGLVEEKNETDE
mgnify:CR=1 FL=1|jgi:ribosome-binding factor A